MSIAARDSQPSPIPSSRLAQHKGARDLDDAALVTAVVGTYVSAAALDQLGGLRGIASESVESLVDRGFLSRARAQRLTAALELGRRALISRDSRPRIVTPEEAFAYLAPNLSALSREVFHVLSFNSRGVLLRDDCVATGSVSTCPVDPRDVFAAALRAKATGIILAHNHPSGDPTPSSQDVMLTRQLESGARLLNIKLLDHVIVGDGSFLSQFW